MLEHGDRRDVRTDENAARHDDRLLQRELTGLDCVRNHVGEHDPGGTRRKFPAVLRTSRLECRVRLEKVMESQHAKPATGPTATLTIASVNGGAHPIAGVGFSVVVEVRGADGTIRNVTDATGVRLNLKTGGGSLGGTLIGTIPAGTGRAVINGATYTKAESGVVLTVTRTSGDTLSSGDSPLFTVDPGAIAGYTVDLFSPRVAGSTFPVAVTALDQFANRVTTDNSTLITLRSSSGHAGARGATVRQSRDPRAAGRPAAPPRLLAAPSYQIAPTGPICRGFGRAVPIP